MRSVMVPRRGIIARQPPLVQILALLHCAEGVYPTAMGALVNSAVAANTFTATGTSTVYWYENDDIFGRCGFTGDNPSSVHSDAKYTVPGAFCMEGFFMPLGINGPSMEIADGDSWNETGDNFITFFNSAVDEDANNYMVQTQIYAKPVGGAFSTIASGNTWAMPKTETTPAHVAFYRDTAGYVGMTYRGQEKVRTSAPFVGSFNGSLNFIGGYDRNNGNIVSGSHQMRFADLRVTRGSGVYTPPFTPRTTRFPNP